MDGVLDEVLHDIMYEVKGGCIWYNRYMSKLKIKIDEHDSSWWYSIGIGVSVSRKFRIITIKMQIIWKYILITCRYGKRRSL